MSDAQAPTTVEAFKDDPVSAGPAAETTSTAAPVEPVEAFKDDPVGPDATVGSVAALPIEEKVNKDEVKITAEPITKGVLGYKAPGLVNQLRFSKKYFWLGDEAIPAKDLGAYLRAEKPEVAHPNAAWSSQTGKGLLYFAKRAEDTKAPAGLINLADISEVAKEGQSNFSFKAYNHKHTFEAKDTKERDGWLVAIETEAKNAGEAREGITTSEAYKENLGQLKKPLPAVAAAAGSTRAISSERKKSTDGANSSADEKPKGSQKSRSQSRGKRGSVFGGLLGKKDETDKKEDATDATADKKDETEAPKTEETESSAVPAAAAAGTIGVVGAGTAAVVASGDKEESTETPATTETKTESPKSTATTSKANKRGSIFGGLFKSDKKDSETPTSKEEETKATEPTATETTETPAVAAATEPTHLDTSAAADSKSTEPTSATTPNKEKRRSSFFAFGSKKDKKSETTATEPPATTATEPPATTAEEPANTTSEEPPKTTAEEPPATAGENIVLTAAPDLKDEHTAPADVIESEKATTSTPATTEKATTEKTDSKKTDTSSKRQSSSFMDILRRPSQALKGGRKEKKDASAATPATVPESVPAITEEKPNLNGATTNGNHIMGNDAKPAETASEPKTLGDVVPEAVSVGEAPQASQTVSATA